MPRHVIHGEEYEPEEGWQCQACGNNDSDFFECYDDENNPREPIYVCSQCENVSRYEDLTVVRSVQKLLC